MLEGFDVQHLLVVEFELGGIIRVLVLLQDRLLLERIEELDVAMSNLCNEFLKLFVSRQSTPVEAEELLRGKTVVEVLVFA